MDSETNTVGPETFGFGRVLELLHENKIVGRLGWHGTKLGQKMHIGLQHRDEGSVNTLPYFYFVPGPGIRVPWVASHSDLLETDWVVVEE